MFKAPNDFDRLNVWFLKVNRKCAHDSFARRSHRRFWGIRTMVGCEFSHGATRQEKQMKRRNRGRNYHRNRLRVYWHTNSRYLHPFNRCCNSFFMSLTLFVGWFWSCVIQAFLRSIRNFAKGAQKCSTVLVTNAFAERMGLCSEIWYRYKKRIIFIAESKKQTLSK